jgi:NTF2-like protein (DUF6841)
MENLFTDYFTNYAKCYDDFDHERLAQFYFAPTLMVKNGSVITIATSSDILDHLKTLLASYREHGYKKGNLAGLDVHTMEHWGVFITVHWIIDHVNGSIMRDFRSSYNLFRQEDVWKILVTTNHDNP